MKCPIFLFLLILTSPLFAIAQSNYKPGYVVTLNGNTIKGDIDYKGWERNLKHISFKSGLNVQKQYSINYAKPLVYMGMRITGGL